MAIRIESSEYLLRTTPVLDYNSPYTWMGHFYVDTSLNSCTFLVIYDAHPGYGSHDVIQQDNTNALLKLQVFRGGTNLGGVIAGAMPTGSWFHLAMVRESVTSLKMYLNGALTATHTGDITGRTAALEMRSGAISVPFDGRTFAQKAWSVALSDDQILTEMNVIRPRRRIDVLWAFWPMWNGNLERIKDYSGYGRDWTAGGTLSDVDNPAVGWGVAPLLVRGMATVTPPTDVYSMAARQQSGADGSGHLGHRVLSY